jgi:hypothetical protein
MDNVQKPSNSENIAHKNNWTVLTICATTSLSRGALLQLVNDRIIEQEDEKRMECRSAWK